MGDGSSCIPVTVCATLPANCNAHGARKLKEKSEAYPEQWQVVKATYKLVKANEDECKERGLNIHDRLALHREKSLPVMNAMFDWMQRELDSHNVEPNSLLGGIFEYFLNRRQKLLAFTEYPGAPIDNNAVEQIIKSIALIRKNALFFKSLTGANDADKILSVGITAGMAEANLYDDFVNLQRYADEVKARPQDFLPWNYKKTVETLQKKRAENRAERLVDRLLTPKEWKDRQDRLRAQRLELKHRRFPKEKKSRRRSRSSG
jgi:hypothetical protein